MGNAIKTCKRCGIKGCNWTNVQRMDFPGSIKSAYYEWYCHSCYYQREVMTDKWIDEHKPPQTANDATVYDVSTAKQPPIQEPDTHDDGGPAFPCPVGHITCEHPTGMSLHDYYVGQALKGLIENELFCKNLAHQYSNDFAGADACVAKNSFSLADAMLVERGKRNA